MNFKKPTLICLAALVACSAAVMAAPVRRHATRTITPKPAAKPVALKRHTSPDGYSFIVPAGWDLKVDPQTGTVMFHPGDGFIGFSVTSMTATTIDELQAGIVEINAESMRQDPSIKYTATKRIDVAGRPALVCIGTKTDIETQKVSPERMVLVHKSGSEWYEFEYVGPANLVPELSKVLTSIQFS